ncbi:phosphatidylserine decarboxylase [Ochrobactrum vermis]|uniref:Phosphatidylserine decarboxylase proenzyme n=1 Tax=Ochrobactrum vermis TaxID=1827297 RepID=A0ABU8PMY2_9HYPH|nr:phosphatidylserine decarboxylase [Ochrobactrum vermis]PQZ24381.1 phosphatidylserine decarboxylase family protein [Ochrobactrum vermis]
MSVVSSVRNSLVPIHPAGYPFIAVGLFATLVLGFVWSPLAWMGGILTAWVVYFFRDPARSTLQSPELIISPADGRVSMITEVLPPPELQLPAKPMLRISVFMSIFDCHVNRMPIAGTVSRIVYTPGRFVNADLDKASEHNERNGLAISTVYGPVAVVQIAGLIARRIVHWVEEGEELGAGQRFGLIRFGSRLDVYIPTESDVLVAVEQRAIAGETPLADLARGHSQRSFRRS